MILNSAEVLFAVSPELKIATADELLDVMHVASFVWNVFSRAIQQVRDCLELVQYEREHIIEANRF